MTVSCFQTRRATASVKHWPKKPANDIRVRFVMIKRIPRNHQRTDSSAIIQYAALHRERPEQYRATRMRNYSAGGMCYETDQKLDPESEVCVVMQNYAPDQPGPERYRSYLIRVRWIEALPDEGNNCYAAGARIIARSHEVLTACSDEPFQFCDLCGVLMPVCCLQRTPENAQLCEQCHKHFQSIPEGKLRECVARFLIGNVI
jgi:hypothetical protein